MLVRRQPSSWMQSGQSTIGCPCLGTGGAATCATESDEDVLIWHPFMSECFISRLLLCNNV